MYAARVKEPPNWWPEFLSMYQKYTIEVPTAYIQKMTKKQAAIFLAALGQAKNSGWFGPPSFQALCHSDLLSPGDINGSMGVWEMRKEKTLFLAKALQCCSELSGWPYSMMCDAARDLQSCKADLMLFEEEDVLAIPLLESADDLPTMSPTPEEEATLLYNHQEAQVTTTHPLMHEEQSPKPEDVGGRGKTATEPHGVWAHPPLPPAFGLAPPGTSPPLLEDDEILIAVPNPEEAWLTLMPMGPLTWSYSGTNIWVT